MLPSDTILFDATASAAEGKNVLFLTHSMATTAAVVARASNLVTDAFARLGRTNTQMHKLVRIDLICPWKIVFPGAGWVFFFPLIELGPDEDVGNPDIVFQSDGHGDFTTLPYLKWKAERKVLPRSIWMDL